MNILITGSITLVLTIIFVLLEKYTKFGRMAYGAKQLLIGICFGISTCLATEFGQQIDGAVINVRDAAPLCAGLLFGGPSGIIAGFMGAVHRLFWGTSWANTFSEAWTSQMFDIAANGGFTRMACTLGTFCSGIFGAFLRKFMFDNKRPPLFYAVAVGITTEVFHLFLVFVFRLNYITRVYDVIKACTLPMITANMLIVAASVLATKIITYDKSARKKKDERKERHLANAIQIGLLLCVFVAFSLTAGGMLLIQNKLGMQQAENLLSKNLSDLNRRIEMDGGIERFIENDFTWHVGNTGGIIIGKYNRDHTGGVQDITIVLNGTDYNKGQVIAANTFQAGTVNKMPKNFIFQTIHINGADTPVYGMYETYNREYILVSYVPVEEATLYQGVTFILTIFFEILVFASIFIQVYALVKRQVVENIDSVNRALGDITRGDLDTEVNVRSHKEFEILSDDINHTVDTLKHYIKDAAARIDAELEFAKSIQHSALPSIFPPFPERREVDIHATMNTAKEVGGDFYDYFFVGEDKLALVIADVSGKGIPAAMFMMQAKTIIKGYAEQGIPTDQVFTKANARLCEGNEAGMFVTALMLIVDLKSGHVEYVNAGHNLPLIRKKGGQFEYFKMRRGLVLAGMEDMVYHMGEFDMAPGDTVYLYTDGVTEATDENKELFGDDRLLETLNTFGDGEMKMLCALVRRAVDFFVGPAPQFDDITMLAFHWNEVAAANEEITVTAEIPNVEPVTEFVDAILERVECPMKSVMQINIAIDELFSNIAKYAYGEEKGEATVRVSVLTNPARVSISFIDSGTPYNPLENDDPDVTLSAEQREIGGLGLYVVKKSMDKVYYKYENGKNVLTIEKNLEGRS